MRNRRAIGVLLDLLIFGAGLCPAFAQSQPDLTVSMNAVPNPVPIGMYYEVQIIITNIEPPLAIKNPDVPHVDPRRPVPPAGADVQQADLLLGSTVASGRVAMQTNPPLPISGCYALGIGSSLERCTIGPLNKGGRWTITLVHRSPVPPGQTFPYTIGYSASIDDLNKLAERDEGNNTAGVTVSFK